MIELHGFGWMLWQGLAVTLAVGICAMFLATAIGLLAARAKLTEHRIARLMVNAYTTVVRGVPELLLLLIVFYGGPTLIQNIAERWGHDIRVDLDAFTAGTLTLGLIYGAFATEVFRGAFLAVPRGEIEAATALGMAPHAVFFLVTLPQAWRHALPGLGNVWMVLIKATALVSIIQLEEIMRMATIGMSVTKLPFNFFFAATLMYLGITLASMAGQRRLEKWARRGIRAF